MQIRTPFSETRQERINYVTLYFPAKAPLLRRLPVLRLCVTRPTPGEIHFDDSL